MPFIPTSMLGSIRNFQDVRNYRKILFAIHMPRRYTKLSHDCFRISEFLNCPDRPNRLFAKQLDAENSAKENQQTADSSLADRRLVNNNSLF